MTDSPQNFIRNFIFNVLSESIELGFLPPTLTQGLKSPSFQNPKKDLHVQLDNWRPICLLNNDYKVLASIFD